MERLCELKIEKWYLSQFRKPLIIRGARQVGKSTLVRQAAKKLMLPLWELNLEKHPHLDEVFKTLNVNLIIHEIQLILKQSQLEKVPGILFLDEIQTTPYALLALRYFHEEKPDMAIVCAGSLLEFTLADTKFSMPVGRIEYMWLGPMSFHEFLLALGDEHLVNYLLNSPALQPNPLFSKFDTRLEQKKGELNSPSNFSQTAHEQLLLRMREYFWIGGMPEAVLRYVETKDSQEAISVHQSILETYRDDFSKYARGTELEKIRRVFDRLPNNLGVKTKYNGFHPDWRSQDIRSCIELLIQAGICIPVIHSNATGIPINALENPNIFKLYHLDIGLVCTAMGITMIPFHEFKSGKFLLEGILAEQFAAQHLFFSEEKRPVLHYWLRDGKSQNAEVDFIIQYANQIFPIEIKSGASGSLRSLHQFMLKNPHHFALRFDLNTPSKQFIKTTIVQDFVTHNVEYVLNNLPLYYLGIRFGK